MAASGRKPMATCAHAAAVSSAASTTRKWDEGARKPTNRSAQLGVVDADGDARRASTQALGELDASLQHVQGLSVRPRQVVTGDLVVHLALRRQGDVEVPQRARAQHGPVRLDHYLPIESRQGTLEPRIGGLAHDGKLAVRAGVDASYDLVEVRRQLDVHPTLDMALEQECQTDCRQGDGSNDEGGGAGEQPEAQRPEAHAAPSVIR